MDGSLQPSIPCSKDAIPLLQQESTHVAEFGTLVILPKGQEQNKRSRE